MLQLLLLLLPSDCTFDLKMGRFQRPKLILFRISSLSAFNFQLVAESHSSRIFLLDRTLYTICADDGDGTEMKCKRMGKTGKKITTRTARATSQLGDRTENTTFLFSYARRLRRCCFYRCCVGAREVNRSALLPRIASIESIKQTLVRFQFESVVENGWLDEKQHWSNAC